jgi:phosphatidylglycerophosphate synthase
VRMPFGAAYEELSQAQKPSRGVSLYSRWINRPLGRFLAAAGAAVGVSPNAVTAISAVMTLSAVVLIALLPPSVLSGLAITALIVLGYALDSADGQLARLTRRGSPAGEWFDHVVDAGKFVCLHSAVLIGVYRHFDVDRTWLFVILAYQLLAVVIQAGGILRELLGRLNAGQKAPAAAGRWASSIALLIADTGVFGLIFLTWSWPQLFLPVYGALFVGNALVGGLLLGKWMRELLHLGAGPAG